VRLRVKVGGSVGDAGEELAEDGSDRESRAVSFLGRWA